VPDEKLAAFVEERVVYVDKLEKVKKAGLDEQAKVRYEKRREELGLGELPAEWANAFITADEDTGWVAAASVVGKLNDVMITEVLAAAGVDPLTGRSTAADH
jgi:ribonuclease HII